MRSSIKHVWFDLSETLAIYTPEFAQARDNLMYRVFAEATKKSVSDELIAQYKKIFKEYGSNAAVFRSLGFSADYWPNHFRMLSESGGFFKPDKRIYGTLEKLREVIPISLFTNVRPEQILKDLQIEPSWFTHIIGSGDIKEPKPALEGFELMIEKSKLPPSQILYIGDMIEKDIRPAKKVGLQTGLMWSASVEADYSFEHFEDVLNLFSNNAN